MKRWLKFNAVGFGGIVVQMVALVLLKSALKLNYLVATAVAVEAAIVHNFFWHERFTWRERCGGNSTRRFMKFNLTTGAISILGNLATMALLVGRFHLNYLISNGISIAVCSTANFLASDRFVFEERTPGAVRPRSRLA